MFPYALKGQLKVNGPYGFGAFMKEWMEQIVFNYKEFVLSLWMWAK